MQINIGGNLFNFPDGSNVTVNRGQIMVNGEVIHSAGKHRPIYVEVTGDINHLRTDNTATIKGNVLGSVEAGNTVECGDVGGDVEAGNSVHAREIKGNVKAGNSIHKSFQLK